MRAACGGNTIYFGPAAENASMAFEQKTNHAMKLPVIVFTYSFRGRTPGLAVVGSVSCWGSRPLLCLAQRMEQIRASDLCAPAVAARQ